MRYLVIMAFVLIVWVGSSTATLININLNTFTADPSSAVTVASDGSSAILCENIGYSSILFYNDLISIPLKSLYLTFKYDFILGDNNIDSFNAYLYDDPTTLEKLKDSNGDPFEILLSSSGSGIVNWSFLNAGFLGSTVGLEIDLNSADMLTNSCVTISDVNIAVSDTTINPIPEPSTILMLMGGLGVIIAYKGFGFGRKKMIK